MPENKKIRLLALCDSPTSATGFAQVSRNILRGLAATGKYEIDVIGINYYGDYYDRTSHPYNIYPAMPQGYSDMYGRGRLIQALSGQEMKSGLTPPWDIVFTIQDSFILEGLGLNYPAAEQIKVTQELWKRTVQPEAWFTWIAYWPVDADLKENWVTKSIAIPDYPVAYCDWGKNQMLKWDREQFDLIFNLKTSKTGNNVPAKLKIKSLKERVEVIHHGVDLKTFKPLPAEDNRKFRKEYFKGVVKDSTFLVINVSRNQPRKDIARTLKAFSLFKQQVPDSHLYLHMKANDAGGSIEEMARNFGLEIGRDYSTPDDFTPGIGFPIEVVNKLYNAADLCITTTLGEGWGFITTEAMATKTPIAAPAITSIIDIFGIKEGQIIGDDFYKSDSIRGIPVLAGTNNSEWILLGLEDNERVRPLTNVDDLVKKMIWVKEHPVEVKKITDRANEWVQTISWEKIVDQWNQLFTKAYAKLQADRQMGQAIDKANRNDPCPCGSGNKFKKCHGGSDNMAKFKDWIEDPV